MARYLQPPPKRTCRSHKGRGRFLKDRRVRSEIASWKSCRVFRTLESSLTINRTCTNRGRLFQGDLFAGVWDVVHFGVVVGNQLARICIVHLKREANPRGQDQAANEGHRGKASCSKVHLLWGFPLSLFSFSVQKPIRHIPEHWQSKARKEREGGGDRFRAVDFPPTSPASRGAPRQIEGCARVVLLMSKREWDVKMKWGRDKIGSVIPSKRTL